MSSFKLDIVIPIYNEQEVLNELYRRICEVCGALDDLEWRIIYIDDGSSDNSMEIMQEQCRDNPRISIIELSRNFGHQAAISVGLSYSVSDAVVIMDADLQDPPEIIPELLEKWKNGGEVVLAQRKSRQEKGIKRLGFEIFHKFFKWISDFPVQPNTGVFGILDKRVVKEMNKLAEKNRYLPGLRSWVGFKQNTIYYDRSERAGGRPKQSLKRLFRYATDAVFSFSYKPLRLMTGIGLSISLVSFMLATVYVIRRLTGIEIAQTGFTTLVTLILFLGGIQLIAIGLLGEYLARVYDEVKGRPLYIVKNKYGNLDS